jgi:CubicO group peptidase (beta-lactamase class C family)
MADALVARRRAEGLPGLSVGWGPWERIGMTARAGIAKRLESQGLYGIAVERGLIDINRTLAELEIDDIDPRLSDVERSARLVDLLTARSGIYHPSIKDDNGPYPEPGAHQPDEAFVYNNWSFNAVGGIFERLTGLSMGEAFKSWIADPIGMQDFRPEDVHYFEGSGSVFPAYRFWMSARDLARFGQLYLNRGRWHGDQVVPESWIVESLQTYSDTGRGVGYGYMWWTMPDSSYMATGTGGQKLRIYPDRGLVLVNRVYTAAGFERAIWWLWGGRVNNRNTLQLLRRLKADLSGVVDLDPDTSNGAS